MKKMLLLILFLKIFLFSLNACELREADYSQVCDRIAHNIKNRIAEAPENFIEIQENITNLIERQKSSPSSVSTQQFITFLPYTRYWPTPLNQCSEEDLSIYLVQPHRKDSPQKSIRLREFTGLTYEAIRAFLAPFKKCERNRFFTDPYPAYIFFLKDLIWEEGLEPSVREKIIHQELLSLHPDPMSQYLVNQYKKRGNFQEAEKWILWRLQETQDPKKWTKFFKGLPEHRAVQSRTRDFFKLSEYYKGPGQMNKIEGLEIYLNSKDNHSFIKQLFDVARKI